MDFPWLVGITYWLVVSNMNCSVQNIWDNPSHWLIFFKMVKTTNQDGFAKLGNVGNIDVLSHWLINRGFWRNPFDREMMTDGIPNRPLYFYQKDNKLVGECWCEYTWIVIHKMGVDLKMLVFQETLTFWIGNMTILPTDLRTMFSENTI